MGEGPLPGGVSGKNTMDKIAAEIEKEPGKNGEKVAGAEALIRETQGRQQPGSVQPFRQLDAEQLAQAQVSGAYIAEEPEQQKAENKSQPGVQSFQQRVEGYEQQHGAADEIQHSEPDGLRGQGDERYSRNHQAPEIYDYSPAEILLLAPAPDEAGDKNKSPADALLPDVYPGYTVPARVQGVDHFHIIHEMIGHHTQHRQAPEGVDAVEAQAFVFHSVLLIRYAYILRQSVKKAREKAAA